MEKCLGLRVHLLLLFALVSTLAFAQRRISGTVTDDKQAPLTGATVTVQGTRAVTTKDAAGKFSLTVPPNGKTPVVSFVGMQPRTVAIGSDDVVNVSLTPTTGALADVVVVGYGRAALV